MVVGLGKEANDNNTFHLIKQENTVYWYNWISDTNKQKFVITLIVLFTKLSWKSIQAP